MQIRRRRLRRKVATSIREAFCAGRRVQDRQQTIKQISLMRPDVLSTKEDARSIGAVTLTTRAPVHLQAEFLIFKLPLMPSPIISEVVEPRGK